MKLTSKNISKYIYEGHSLGFILVLIFLSIFLYRNFYGAIRGFNDLSRLAKKDIKVIDIAKLNNILIKIEEKQVLGSVNLTRDPFFTK